MKTENEICQSLLEKGSLKLQIYETTLEMMKLFKEAAQELEQTYNQQFSAKNPKVKVKFTDRNQFEFQIKFAGDVLVFFMHTNVFEFSRNHEVMRTPYIKEDKSRSYCGMIYIYNFLSDSFKYNRLNDIGYLIGRVMVNKEKHYYIDGKREVAQILNNFTENEFTKETIKEILFSAMKYAIDFDLLVPDYDNNIQMSVCDVIQIESENTTMKTGKRLGFRFEPDNLAKL